MRWLQDTPIKRLATLPPAASVCPSLPLPTLHVYRCIPAPPSGAVTPSGAPLPEGGLPWSLLLLKAGGAGLSRT